MTIKVLLADDHAIVVDGLRVLLETHADIKVTGVARNGREAVEPAGRLRPDVVIMAETMPDLNGIGSTQKIHSAHPDVRVIMLSMHGTPEHIYRALQAGAQGYLLKDSAGTEVVRAVRAVHVGRRYFSEQISTTMLDDYLHDRHSHDPLDQLSSREREIVQMVAEGRTSAQIAQVLGLSAKSVETYRSRAMHKLKVSDVPGLVKIAIQYGLISLD
ncbi:MAG: response regulator transcription factor [Acidobacteriota bacterium]